MANNEDEIEKILKEIKGSKNSKDESSGETADKTNTENHHDEKPLEPALNDLPEKKATINDYKDE